MLRIAVLFCALLGATASAEEIFRCKGAHGTTYQQHPCPETGEELFVRPHEPSEAERGAVQERVAREQRLLQHYDDQREKSRAKAERFRARKDAERAALDRRCAQYEEALAAMARKQQGKKSGTAGNHQTDRRRILEGKHFSECFAKR